MLWTWAIFRPDGSLDAGDAGTAKGSGVALGAMYEAILQALKSALAAGWVETGDDRGIVLVSTSRTVVSRVAGDLAPRHEEEAKVVEKIQELCRKLNGRVVWEPSDPNRSLGLLAHKACMDRVREWTRWM